MNTLKIPLILTALWIFICAMVAGYFILIGTGMFPQPNIGFILLAAVLILLLSSSKKTFYFILLPIACVHAFYTPVGLNFGAPSYQYIASVFATDMLETREFLLQIPTLGYLIALAIPILIFIQYKSAVKFSIKFYRNKTFLTLSALLFAYHLPLAAPVKESVNSTLKIYDEVKKLKQMSHSHNWGKSTLEDSRYDDYVLIIGESARQDYHHAYGYPVKNTPFMSNAKGTLINGFRSAGTNTIASLRLMLTLPNKEKWEPNYDLSLVDLIKSAGIKTYWLSNQGLLGEFDTPVSSLAAKSDETFFLKKGGSSNSTNYSDFDLLPKFVQILENPTENKRFIVLHIYGSHPWACDRVEDYPKIFKDDEIDPKYAYLNCYISSIKKTDEFLERVYKQLQQNAQKNHRTFSMIYFSDHGLCHQKDEKHNLILFNQNCFSRSHHNIPLFKIASDDTERKEYKVFKSGLNFVEGIANWIGIKNPKLTVEEDLFSAEADKDDFGLQKRIDEKYEKGNDPAINILPKHK
ncbi:sulfatase-like hydrolase/transferase [Pasteurella caecimuris]|uniref:phosphoethanolamine transferase n=1 Tax=Rodentibacter caecimuris TaxID=1796644 RepID=UPI00214F6B36|nr:MULTISPECIES: sulfatase-like hydrolase/transferase [Pasteurellaceae]MCR1838272.1 sulfatase-like hydrolase/transferase [Pasteurella caecimuris]MCU0107396.1 sulfatase-like hydrolase/transferase [Pasteurella caecimuris]MCX2960917.1 sulfatase-like hydrolase/transferase [Rodentibacter heylii]